MTVVYGGWHFPDKEEHLPAWMKKVNDWRQIGKDNRLLYQGRKYREAMGIVNRFKGQRRNVVDIGGHIGLWSWQMAADFQHVYAFEPMPRHRACYEINMSKAKNWTLFPFALGETPGVATLRTRTPNSSGDTGIDLRAQPGGSHIEGLAVEVKRLDDFNLENVDFLKLDCEGFEVFVLRGGIETLKRNKPVVIVEQKPETGMEKSYGVGTKDAVALLQGLGAVQAMEMAGDHVMFWK